MEFGDSFARGEKATCSATNQFGSYTAPRNPATKEIGSNTVITNRGMVGMMAAILAALFGVMIRSRMQLYDVWKWLGD